ncbi:hypothetical protein L917_20613 [Phytophthora nicotianae]|nr:hypothetical protein L917_20613 [Phytophthora nicotianae]ETM31869.1 hypothetical protein L914_20633 [Phytophthora nicotianae]
MVDQMNFIMTLLTCEFDRILFSSRDRLSALLLLAGEVDRQHRWSCGGVSKNTKMSAVSWWRSDFRLPWHLCIMLAHMTCDTKVHGTTAITSDDQLGVCGDKSNEVRDSYFG